MRRKTPQKVSHYSVLELTLKAVIRQAAKFGANDGTNISTAMRSGFGSHVCIIQNQLCIVKKKTQVLH